MRTDKNINICEFLSDEAIMHAIWNETAYTHSDDDDSEEVIIPLANWQTVNILQKYLASCENVSKSIFIYIHVLNDFLKYDKQQQQQQKKM